MAKILSSLLIVWVFAYKLCRQCIIQMSFWIATGEQLSFILCSAKRLAFLLTEDLAVGTHALNYCNAFSTSPHSKSRQQ